MTQATRTPAPAAPDAAAIAAEYALIAGAIDGIRGFERLVLEGRLVELEREYDRLTQPQTPAA